MKGDRVVYDGFLTVFTPCARIPAFHPERSHTAASGRPDVEECMGAVHDVFFRRHRDRTAP
jgi:hypothetical protein